MVFLVPLQHFWLLGPNNCCKGTNKTKPVTEPASPDRTYTQTWFATDCFFWFFWYPYSTFLVLESSGLVFLVPSQHFWPWGRKKCCKGYKNCKGGLVFLGPLQHFWFSGPTKCCKGHKNCKGGMVFGDPVSIKTLSQSECVSLGTQETDTEREGGRGVRIPSI